MSLRIGQKIHVNGIEYEVLGGKHPYYRLTHKCSRMVAEPTTEGLKLRSVTVRLNTHRKIENAES